MLFLLSLIAQQRHVEATTCARWIVPISGHGSISDGQHVHAISPDTAVYLPAGTKAYLHAREPMRVVRASAGCDEGSMRVVRLSRTPVVPLGRGDVAARVIGALVVLDFGSGGGRVAWPADEDEALLFTDADTPRTLEAREDAHRIEAFTAARAILLAHDPLARVEALRAPALVAGFVGVEAEGALDATAVKTAIEARKNALLACAEDDLYGLVRIGFTIEPDGQPSKLQALQNDTGKGAVESCLYRALGTTRFEKRARSTRVAYPFIFAAPR